MSAIAQSEKYVNSLLIWNEPPQIHLKEVGIDLNLLQAILAESLQSHTFQKSL